VVISGGPGLSSRIYQKYLAPLAEKYQLILWDYQGTGASRAHSEFSFEADYHDFDSLMNELGLKNVNVLAHSYGSLVALRYATQNPDRIAKLILSGGSPTFEKSHMESFDRKKETFDAADYERYEKIMPYLLMNLASKEDALEFMRLEWKFHFHRKLTSEEIDALVEDAEFNMTAFLSNTDWIEADYTSKLASIKSPTLVLTSKHDGPVPPKYAEPLRQIPNSKFFEFENSGHWPLIDETELFRRQVEEFLG